MLLGCDWDVIITMLLGCYGDVIHMQEGCYWDVMELSLRSYGNAAGASLCGSGNAVVRTMGTENIGNACHKQECPPTSMIVLHAPTDQRTPGPPRSAAAPPQPGEPPLPPLAPSASHPALGKGFLRSLLLLLCPANFLLLALVCCRLPLVHGIQHGP